jgi:TPR repeat protein
LEEIMNIRGLLICLLSSMVVVQSVYAVDEPELSKLYDTARTGDPKALEDLRAEAAEGNSAAQLMLGNMYGNGTGVSKDYNEAHVWYTKAAELGLSEAQYNLGQMYRKGLGVSQDDKKAAEWYRRAADQANPGAMFNLGGMYLEGRGVPQSDAEAKKLLKRAAALGHQGAQRALSQLE